MATRIVLVDDTDDVRYLLAIAAEQAGAEVVGEADSADRAIALVRMTRPDAVVLDNVMPGMNGVDAIPALRLASPTTVIVMYSSDPDPAVRDKAREHGAAAYHEKLVVRPAEVIDTCLRLTTGER